MFIQYFKLEFNLQYDISGVKLPANDINFMKFPSIGPAFLVTAAFIGPGTVITASLAGANFGYSLLWALLFSMFATLILQEMAARLGVITQQGLGENIRQTFNKGISRWIAIGLVVSAIVIGNGAYESGNISGASIGLVALFDGNFPASFFGINIWPFFIGLMAFMVLWRGNYFIVEKVLIFLVAVMSLAFMLTFFMTQPDLTALFSGLLIPQFPTGSTLTVIALIGTTVVPYNLFLHSASASRKWKQPSHLSEARKDLLISIPLGGLISIAIVSTAATAFFGKAVSLQSVADLAPALEPVFGDSARLLMAIGLFSAGVSSAVTAPLAAAFALSGVLDWNSDLRSGSFKSIWLAILIIGVVISSSDYKAVSVIWFAQVANGILLPVICVFLIWIMNTKLLGEFRNNLVQNVMGGFVLLVTLLLSGRSLMSAFGYL